MTYYTRAFSSYPDNYYACTGLAVTSLEKGLFEDALRYCKKAISIKKPDIEIHIYLAIIYESIAKTDLFKEEFQEILRYYKSDEAAVYNRLAFMYRLLCRFKEAEYYMKQAINLTQIEHTFTIIMR